MDRHSKVDTTLDVYTQVLDGAAREAADRIGSELGQNWPEAERNDGAKSLMSFLRHR
jgi:hypothetical protein